MLYLKIPISTQLSPINVNEFDFLNRQVSTMFELVQAKIFLESRMVNLVFSAK